jgi:ABC-2 type transport system ATP-binding protein
LIDRFGLAAAAGRLAGTYSAGMRRQLDLAMGLMGEPRVVFLDEPTTGLDPRARRIMWQIIRELAAQGVTIFLTTQYLEEADQLADRIAVLDNGKLAAEGTGDELKRLIPGGHVRLRFAGQAEFESAARLLVNAVRDESSLALQVPSDGGVRSLLALLDRMDTASIDVDGLSLRTPDLEDVFLALTGHVTEEIGSR